MSISPTTARTQQYNIVISMYEQLRAKENESAKRWTSTNTKAIYLWQLCTIQHSRFQMIEAIHRATAVPRDSVRDIIHSRRYTFWDDVQMLGLEQLVPPHRIKCMACRLGLGMEKDSHDPMCGDGCIACIAGVQSVKEHKDGCMCRIDF